MENIEIGDKIQTPVGILIVDEIVPSDINPQQTHVFLTGCGFTWNGILEEFRKNNFKKI